jgi:hypothetical protein
MVTSSSTPNLRSDEGSSPSAAMTRLVRDEMGETWRHDPKFFKKFFPVRKSIKGQCADVKTRLFNYTHHRWKGITPRPKSAAALSTAFLHLLNNTLEACELHKNRRFFKTKRQKVATGRETVTSPAILLAGAGPEFMNTGVQLPFAQYAQGIAAFEVRLQSPVVTQGHGRLAVHAHEIFSDQENRRFVFGVVLTEETLTVCMFDHSGAIFSDPLDYHQNPDQFCAVISGLASSDALRLGFDSTMYSEDRRSKIRTMESDGTRQTRRTMRQQPSGTVYTIKESVFRFPTVVGKGTLCWLVRDDRTDVEYVIKDAWIAPEELPGRESEASLLWHVQRQGVFKGVAQIRYFEEVLLGNESTAIDSILHNRRTTGAGDRTMERMHTRLVLSTHGKPLDHFSSPMEFLLAYHDAVVGASTTCLKRPNVFISSSAHRNLYEIAGILHRDVSVRNILINAGGEEGDRGILIDFDHAIRVGDTSPYSAKRKIVSFVSPRTCVQPLSAAR